MKVAQIIEALQKLPPDAEVVSYQYEYDDYFPVDRIKYKRVNIPEPGSYFSPFVDKTKELTTIVEI